MKLPVTPSFKLDGRRALVTGGSSGIGFGCAAALAQAGAHVVVAARRDGPLAEAVDTLTSAGYSAESMLMDVSNVESITTAMKSQAAFHVVVNSAGMAIHSPALETTLADYQQVMDTNVRGAYFVSVGAAQGMVKAGLSGSIIHISSQMGSYRWCRSGGLLRIKTCGRGDD